MHRKSGDAKREKKVVEFEMLANVQQFLLIQRKRNNHHSLFSKY